MRKLDQRALLLVLGVGALVALGVGVVVKWQPSGGGDDGSVTSMATTTANEAAAPAPAQPEKQQQPQKSQKPKAPAVPTIVVREGEPVGGVAELTYDKGERAKFRVTSDSAEEIHLHGYDIGKEVEAGGTVTFDFDADLEGIFEIELEERATQIAELTVNP
ncbi:MAG: hypothetical protein JST59_12145 [Actinobacteria bacterium]|nr:hypothetical protein [Actinomycetota bacterium]